MIKRENKNHVFGLDFLRGIAIVLMFITHGFRLFVKSQDVYVPSEDFSERLLNLFAVIEPYTSSLFLFLAGIGLTISFQNNKYPFKTWVFRHSKKAIQLYLIGMGLFFIEKGYQVPDFWVSPSILSTIAVSIVVTALSLKYKYTTLIALIATGLITYGYQGTGVPGVNAGPGGIFPLIMFSLLGSQVWSLVDKGQYKIIYFMLITSGITWFIPGDWVQRYNSSYKIWTSGATGFDFLQSQGESFVVALESYWNHSLLAFARLTGVLILSLMVCLKYQYKLEEKIYNHSLSLIGRHALGCYILHLLIISLFDLFKLYPNSSTMCWLFILGLLICAIGYSKVKEK